MSTVSPVVATPSTPDVLSAPVQQRTLSFAHVPQSDRNGLRARLKELTNDNPDRLTPEHVLSAVWDQGQLPSSKLVGSAYSEEMDYGIVIIMDLNHKDLPCLTSLKMLRQFIAPAIA